MEDLNPKKMTVFVAATLIVLSGLAILTMHDYSSADCTATWSSTQHDDRTLYCSPGETIDLEFEYYNDYTISRSFYVNAYQDGSLPSGLTAEYTYDGSYMTAIKGSLAAGTYTFKVRWGEYNSAAMVQTANDIINITLVVAPFLTHTLSYNANGGSGAPATQSSTDQNSTAQFTVSNVIPTRSGFTFLGWSTDPNATSASYSGGNSISVGNGTVTLYAIWKVDINIADDTVLTGNTVFYTPVVEGTVTVSGADWLIANGNTIYGTAPSSPGIYEVTVSCGTSTEQFTLTVVSALAPTNTPSNGAIVFVKG